MNSNTKEELRQLLAEDTVHFPHSDVITKRLNKMEKFINKEVNSVLEKLLEQAYNITDGNIRISGKAIKSVRAKYHG